MRCRVRELVGTGDVAARGDVREPRSKELVRLDRAAAGGVDPERLQPQPVDARSAPDRNQQLVELDPNLGALVFRNQDLPTAFDHAFARRVARQHADAFAPETLGDGLRHVRILARQDARQHFDLSDLRAEARERLGQFRADRSAAQHEQSGRQLAQLPQRLRRQIADLLQTGDRRHERPRARCDHDRARGQGARARTAINPAIDLDRPG